MPMSTRGSLYPRLLSRSVRPRCTRPGTSCSRGHATSRRPPRRPSCSRSSIAAPFAAIWWSARALGLALRARLDAARGGLRGRARLRLPALRALASSTRSRAGLAPVLTLGGRRRPARPRRLARPRCSACCSSPPASCSCAAREGSLGRAGVPRRADDDRGLDRRVHAGRPQRDPARGCIQLLPARPAGPCLVYPPVVGLAAVSAGDRPADASLPRRPRSPRSCSACSRCGGALRRRCSPCAPRRS